MLFLSVGLWVAEEGMRFGAAVVELFVMVVEGGGGRNTWAELYPCVVQGDDGKTIHSLV